MHFYLNSLSLPNFFSVSKLSIKSIILENYLSNKFNLKNLNFDSNSNYVLDNKENNIVFLTTNAEDQILNFYFNKEYFNIKKIYILLNLTKLNLANISVCSYKNEN